MDPELDRRLLAIEAKVEHAAKSAEATRKYILWTAIISIALFVLPLIGLLFVIPKYLQTLNLNISGL